MTRQDICTHPSVSSSKFLLGLELRSVQRSRAAGWGRRETLLRWGWGWGQLGRKGYKSHWLRNCPSAPAVVLSCYMVNWSSDPSWGECTCHRVSRQPGACHPPGPLCCPSLHQSLVRFWAPGAPALGALATLHCGSSWLRPLTWKASWAHQFSVRSLTFSLVRPACHSHASSKCN
uniref:Uncharacterized protein n=1 Tax=Myotis myotis TaxID=51298 RepID=A0A7J7XH64_MYOMY|nr:hypothetical protein mMyoMyo1_011612 [Myotis myotis]